MTNFIQSGSLITLEEVVCSNERRIGYDLDKTSFVNTYTNSLRLAWPPSWIQSGRSEERSQQVGQIQITRNLIDRHHSSCLHGTRTPQRDLGYITSAELSLKE